MERALQRSKRAFQSWKARSRGRANRPKTNTISFRFGREEIWAFGEDSLCGKTRLGRQLLSPQTFVCIKNGNSTVYAISTARVQRDRAAEVVKGLN